MSVICPNFFLTGGKNFLLQEWKGDKLTWARGGRGDAPPLRVKKVPSPVPEKWVPITKKSAYFIPPFLAFILCMSLLPSN